MEKIELSVQSFSEISSDIQNIFKNRNTSALQYNHMLYVLVGDKVYSCADSPEGKSLINQISTVFSDSIYSEKEIWKSAIEGFADPAAFQHFNKRLPHRIALTAAKHGSFPWIMEMLY